MVNETDYGFFFFLMVFDELFALLFPFRRFKCIPFFHIYFLRFFLLFFFLLRGVVVVPFL